MHDVSSRQSYLRTDRVEGWEERIMERGGLHAVFAGRGISQEHPYHCQLIEYGACEVVGKVSRYGDTRSEK
ncbi:hypothetical protein VSDG_01368 [Cytospora chrysosperma]|uniref:Uncharacterized protein n=1 Tax=Cytospora chrysosperma TaxID=252740 RepID=A0A423WJF2_CYTCH|nr:hypothetical protein VSDG_01368 [Valsa sordida]